MFGLIKKKPLPDTSPAMLKIDALMVQDKLREASIECRTCGDTGVANSVRVTQDFPDRKVHSFQNCPDCDKPVKPSVVKLVNQLGGRL